MEKLPSTKQLEQQMAPLGATNAIKVNGLTELQCVFIWLFVYKKHKEIKIRQTPFLLYNQLMQTKSIL